MIERVLGPPIPPRIKNSSVRNGQSYYAARLHPSFFGKNNKYRISSTTRNVYMFASSYKTHKGTINRVVRWVLFVWEVVCLNLMPHFLGFFFGEFLSFQCKLFNSLTTPISLSHCRWAECQNPTHHTPPQNSPSLSAQLPHRLPLPVVAHRHWTAAAAAPAIACVVASQRATFDACNLLLI